MYTMRSLSAAVLVAAAVVNPVSSPLTCSHIAVHFDLAEGQTPENIALAPGGTEDITLAKARQVAEVSANDTVRILATLPIPILPDGRAGAVRTVATDLKGIDDFAFTGDDLLAAVDPASEVALVHPDGSHSIVLTSADELQNPTSIAVRRDTVYVMSAAWITAKDPNMVVAHLER